MKNNLLIFMILCATNLFAQTPDTICNGAKTWYKVDKTVGSVYKWGVYKSKGTIVSGQNTDSINIQWNNTNGMDSVWVVESNAGGCIGDTSRLKIVLGISPTVSMGTTATLCTPNLGSPVKFILTGTSPWTLSYSENNIPINKTVNASPYIIPATSLTQSMTYKLLSLKDATGCSATVPPNEVIITVLNGFNNLIIKHK